VENIFAVKHVKQYGEILNLLVKNMRIGKAHLTPKYENRKRASTIDLFNIYTHEKAEKSIMYVLFSVFS
jgi:hypothetical protein